MWYKQYLQEKYRPNTKEENCAMFASRLKILSKAKAVAISEKDKDKLEKINSRIKNIKERQSFMNC